MQDFQICLIFYICKGFAISFSLFFLMGNDHCKSVITPVNVMLWVAIFLYRQVPEFELCCLVCLQACESRSAFFYVKRKKWTLFCANGDSSWEVWSDTELVHFTALLWKQKLHFVCTAEVKYWKLHPAFQTINLIIPSGSELPFSVPSRLTL